MNRFKTSAIGALLAVAALGAMHAAHAQGQAKTIRIVVGYAAGGSIDSGARVIAPLLEAKLQQPVVVDNRPGGNGVIAVQALLTAPADGNTLYMQSTSVTTKVFIKDFPIDVMQELVPVAPLWTVSYFLITNGPATDVKQFVSYAKANKGQLNYAAGTPSGMLTMEALKVSAGIDMVSVPYKGSAPSLLAMLANDTQATFDTVGVYKQHLDSGKMHALLYTGKSRNPVMPQVPTASEAGLPELQMSLTGGLWAKAGAPAAQVQRINAAINEIVQRPDVQKRFQEIGWGAIGGTSTELRQQVAAEMGFWDRAAKLINYKPE